MNKIGEVYTYRKQENVNKGYGLIDPTKVFYKADENGKIIIDGVKCSITKEYNPPNVVIIGNKVYHQVEINGLTWLQENLDLPTDANNYRYLNNDESTYGPNGLDLGLMYNYAGVDYLETNKSTLFPGWHVATRSEIESLVTFCGGYSTDGAGTKLKTTDEWTANEGTDNYNFHARPAGWMTSSTTVYKGYGEFVVYYDTYTEDNKRHGIQLSNAHTKITNGLYGTNVFSYVRLVKDHN